jgi:hypothetical protein
VLEHLADRRQILDRLVATLRPGGWILIEDYDWSCFGFEDETPGFGDIADVIPGFMAKDGLERDHWASGGQRHRRCWPHRHSR